MENSVDLSLLPPRIRGHGSCGQQSRWLFTHAAAWHHHLPESLATLYPSYMVMLYDLKYTSLEANHKLPASKHILADISPKDIETFKAEVAKALNA